MTPITALKSEKMWGISPSLLFLGFCILPPEAAFFGLEPAFWLSPSSFTTDCPPQAGNQSPLSLLLSNSSPSHSPVPRPALCIRFIKYSSVKTFHFIFHPTGLKAKATSFPRHDSSPESQHLKLKVKNLCSTFQPLSLESE